MRAFDECLDEVEREEEQAKHEQKAKDQAKAEPDFPEIIMLDDCKLDTDVFWAIDDFLPRCGMMMVYGASGCGKTYLMTSVSLGVGSGRWFDREAEQGCTLICAFERPEDAEDRLNALRERHALKGAPVGLLKLGGVTLNHQTADGIIFRAKQIAKATALPCRSITIDTQAAALGRKEDDEGLAMLRTIGERLHAETGAMIVWNHHEGKSDNMGPRGHLMLADACTVWWHVGERESGERIVHVAKANRGPVHQDLFAFRLVPFEAGRDRKDKAITLCDVELVSLETAQESPVRQRFGNRDGGTRRGPQPGSLQTLLLKALKKLQARNPDGVDRDALRSHFIQLMNEARQRKGEEPLVKEEAATAFRGALRKAADRVETLENGQLRLAE